MVEEKVANSAVEGDNKDSGSKKDKKKNFVIPPKKPKLTKAERRALQEAQRAAKEKNNGSKKGGNQGGKSSKQHPKNQQPNQQQQNQNQQSQPQEGNSESTNNKHDVNDSNKRTSNLFSHLPSYKEAREPTVKLDPKNKERLHSQVLALGEQYAQGCIRGGNARCKAMLRVFQAVVRDYTPTANCKDYRQDLDHNVLKPAFQYWTSTCRLHSVSMGNAFTFVKLAVANLKRDFPLEDAKQALIETMEEYIQQRIVLAGHAISGYASTKIVNGDVLLTYANSDVISLLLQEAMTKNFTVIVVDSRPLLEGRTLLKKLTAAGIQCTYVLLNALSYVVMKEVTKVFLGAAALMSDGSVLSRVGTACVALMARSNNIPVLVCCETYKISNRVQLESITGNELGNPNDIVVTRSGSSVLSNWTEMPNLTLLNPLYDLTPSEFVSGIVTEMGILPSTSVAVLLREMNPQDNDAAFKSQSLY